MSERKIVSVLGATGYVGGRLVPELLDAGYQVRACGRSLKKLACRSFSSHPNAELVSCDLFDPDSLDRALEGCDFVFYLVHSMQKGTKDFASADKTAAINVVQAAHQAGVKRIVYLGGLGEDSPNLSEHLQSRREVARVLQSGEVPVTWFRAAMILGSGSASFEIMRYLVERLPVMITPKWVRTECQPIAISNVIIYLKECLSKPETMGNQYDICGPDIVTYDELFQIYAKAAGLRKRFIIPVPVLTPVLSSYWIHLITPVPAILSRPLTEGLVNKVVCRDHSIQQIIPQKLLSCREAISKALQSLKNQTIPSCWSDSGPLNIPEWLTCSDASYAGGTIFECSYAVKVQGDIGSLWHSVTSIGGRKGWYFGDLLWKLRGWLDRLLGGFGHQRGRRVQEDLSEGDALDFWRVLHMEENKRLVLLSEMKMPGEAILEIRLVHHSEKVFELQIISLFLPRGLAGILYWYSLYPAHGFVFKGMLRSIVSDASASILSKSQKILSERLPCSL